MIATHVHSMYSALDGHSKIEEIADRVEHMGHCACALTDHGVVAGHLELDKVFRKRGLKPLFGCELYHGVRIGEKLGQSRDQAHLIALAMTDEGLKNLWRLNDAAAQEPKFHHVGRVSTEDLRRYREGIVFTSACPLGLVAKEIMRGDTSSLNMYLDLFGDDFLIALTTYPDSMFFDKEIEEPFMVSDLNRALTGIAQERGLRVIAEDDAHYAWEKDWPVHDAYVAKNTGDTIFTPLDERGMYHPEGALCMKDEATVRRNLAYLPEDVVDEAVATTDCLAERADAHLPQVERHLPVFIPDGSPWVEKGKYADDAADQLFIDLLEEGMHKRYGEDPSAIVEDKTVYEAEVFIKAGLHHYFLLAWDVMQFADQPNVIFEDSISRAIERGPGRGSSAGCINAFELGITDIDPLPYDLIFERFWNPGRAEGFPDIDSDFEKGRRSEIKEYLKWRWGKDRVRSIGNIAHMKPKSVIEKMWYACGLTWDEMDDLKNIVDKVPDLDILGHKQIGWSRETEPGKVIYVMEEVGDKLTSYVAEQPKNRQGILVQFLDYCDNLCNRISNYGVHASGIVISDIDLPDYAPCRFAGAKDQRIPVTQFPMDDIDALKLVKFDALGLRTLDVLAEWKQWLKDEHGIDLEWSQLEWEDHPDEMWEQLWEYYAGIFQIEKGLPAKLCKEFRPANVADLSIILAMNRPGPIRSGAPDSFIRRRNGLEETTYDDPFVKDLLQETYGWFLYQEQVIRYFGKLGYTEGEADAVRKILGKKQPEKWLALFHGRGEWKGRSYIEMAARNGLGDISKTKAVAWEGEDIKDKSGKLIYRNDAVNAWVVWCKLVDFAKYSFNKAHTVAYATISFRTNFAKYYGPDGFFAACVNNVDKQKKAERIPDFINEARRKGIKVHGPDIERSMALVRAYLGDIYFGFNDVKNVSEAGSHYLVKLRDQEKVPVGSPEELGGWIVDAGKERSKENARRKKVGEPKLEGKSPGQTLNSGHIESLYTAGAWERLENYPTPVREMQAREKEMLSVILTDNCEEVLAANRDIIEECDTYEEATAPYPGEDVRYTLPGIITSVRETTTRAAGKKMGIVTIEYEAETIEFAVFPDAWRSMRFLWQERTPGIFTIKHALNNKTQKPGYHFESGEILNV